MTKTPREQREEAIRRIRSLIRLANSTTFEPEAKQARLKAGYLMARWKLNYEEDVVEQAPRPMPRPAPAPPVATPVYGWTVSQTYVRYTAGNGYSQGFGNVIFTIRIG